MLPIKLDLPENFLEEENREGYLVKKEIKALWAVELDLLNELLSFCSKNDITVYAAFGTLLGAARHSGFIPWDDDIDVCMKRQDYDKFCRIAHFDSPYFLQTEYTDIGFTRAFARLRNSNTTAIQAYEKNFRISYNQGIFIDIFPLDYMPEDIDERKAAVKQYQDLRNKAMRWSLFSFRCNMLKGKPFSSLWIKKCISDLSKPLLKTLNYVNPYTAKMDKFCSGLKDTNKLGVYWVHELDRDDCFDLKDYEDIDYLPFEMLSIPVPSGFEKILEKEFGDWKTPIMADNTHGELIIDYEIPYTEFLICEKD